MVVRNLSPEKAVTLVVVVLAVIIKLIVMNAIGRKARDFVKNHIPMNAADFPVECYLAGHEAALSSVGSNCIKWVKASERLPSKSGKYYCKDEGMYERKYLEF